MYILQYIDLNFQKLFCELNILYTVFVKYALMNSRSPYQYIITIDLHSIRISIRINKQASIGISKQRDRGNQH